MFCRTSGVYLFYSFSLLTSEQAMLCQSDESLIMGSCENTYICSELASGHDVVYTPDTSNPDYFNNWFLQMGLLCMNPAIIGLLFTIERLSEGVVGFLLYGKTEGHGRKNAVLFFLSINLLAQTILIFCPWYYTRLLGYILYAVGQIKNSAAYAWIFESLETRHKSTAVTAVNMLDASTMGLWGLYILFVSRDWWKLVVCMYSISLINFFVIFFVLPESPKYLLIKGKPNEALESFEYISKFNGMKECPITKDAVFIESALAGHLPPQDKEEFNTSIARVNELFSNAVANLSKINESILMPVNMEKQKSESAPASNIETAEEAKIRFQILMLWIAMINAYYLAYFNIESLEGNMFVNAIVLGVAEVSAQFLSGLLLLKVKEDTGLRICCAVGAIANIVLPFITQRALGYFVLYFAVGGIGGMFNCMYVVLEMQVNPARLASVMQFVFATGAAASAFVSIFATLPQPGP